MRKGSELYNSPTIQPVAAYLPDQAWIRAAQQPNDAGAALTAILKAVNGPTPSRTVRLAAAMVLEPHLLTSLLPEAQAREWRRLVGQEAEPRTGNMVGFAARTNQGWGTAVSNHRGNGRLIENLAAGTWARGPGLDAFDTVGWPDGRAGFVLEALAALDLDATVTAMPDEVRGWITHAADAAHADRCDPDTMRAICERLVALEAENERMRSGGIGLIAAERQRHTDGEGWTPEQDDSYVNGELATAALFYVAASIAQPQFDPISSAAWPWDYSWFKPTTPVRNLVKAASLIAAEIDRLERAGRNGGKHE